MTEKLPAGQGAVAPNTRPRTPVAVVEAVARRELESYVYSDMQDFYIAQVFYDLN